MTIILVGAFHARKRPVGEGAEGFDPMAFRLSRLGSVLSLQLRHAGGTTWGCQLKPGIQLQIGASIPPDAIACGENRVQANAGRRPAPSISLGPTQSETDDEGFDGAFWMGPIHASPPAVPDAGPVRPAS